MQTNLAEWARDSKLGQEADDILRRCVHCGFCTATCPTYQVLGDELDSPRGRIYLVKEVLEGKEPTQATQQHLDRCLTCRNCETTCPSGVQYGHLVDIGRQIVEEKVERPFMQRLQRTLLRKGLVSPLFAQAYKLGQALRRAIESWPHDVRVVVLGTTGRNFAAGMSGGVAYVLDLAGDFAKQANTSMVGLEKLEKPAEIAELRAIIQRHVDYTKSARGQQVLAADQKVIVPGRALTELQRLVGGDDQGIEHRRRWVCGVSETGVFNLS